MKNDRVLGPDGKLVLAGSVSAEDFQNSPTVLKVELHETKARLTEALRVNDELKVVKDELIKANNATKSKLDSALELNTKLEEENKKLAAEVSKLTPKDKNDKK